MNHTPDAYQDIRDAVRALCAGFPDEYHRKVDEVRGLSLIHISEPTRPY